MNYIRHILTLIPKITMAFINQCLLALVLALFCVSFVLFGVSIAFGSGIQFGHWTFSRLSPLRSLDTKVLTLARLPHDGRFRVLHGIKDAERHIVSVSVSIKNRGSSNWTTLDCFTGRLDVDWNAVEVTGTFRARDKQEEPGGYLDMPVRICVFYSATPIEDERPSLIAGVH